MKTLLFVSGLLFIFNISAQDTTKNCRISEVQIMFGPVTSFTNGMSVNNFKKFAPESQILNKDFSEFDDFLDRSNNTETTFALQTALQFKKNKNALLNFGFNYSNQSNAANFLSLQESHPHDTLTSSQTGQQYYLDSTVYKSARMYNRSEVLLLEASFIYRLFQERRWSFYTGIGLGVGIGFNSQTQIEYRESYDVTNFNDNSGSSQITREAESFDNKNYLIYALNVPIGVDFRIGEKNEFLRQLHVFYSIRPSMSFSSIPEYKTFAKSQIANYFGFRVAF